MDGKAAIRNYRDLVAWQKAMELVASVYATSRQWPKDELYALTAQVRRAVVSIPSNIAEGQGRGSGKEFLHHLRIARGSLFEMETQLLVAERLGYIEHTAIVSLLSQAVEVGRLLNGLIRAVGTMTTDN